MEIWCTGPIIHIVAHSLFRVPNQQCNVSTKILALFCNFWKMLPGSPCRPWNRSMTKQQKLMILLTIIFLPLLCSQSKERVFENRCRYPIPIHLQADDFFISEINITSDIRFNEVATGIYSLLCLFRTANKNNNIRSLMLLPSLNFTLLSFFAEENSTNISFHSYRWYMKCIETHQDLFPVQMLFCLRLLTLGI